MSEASILHRILEWKVEEVARRRAQLPFDELQAQIAAAPAPRDFLAAIKTKLKNRQAAVIAEIKKASPSKGVIRDDFFPAEIAKSYEKGNAACLSVLTDREFFQGADSFVAEVKAASKLPVLRKDFIVDEYQVHESRAIGTDCILLIVAGLEQDRMRDLYQLATELDLDVLLEVHDARDLERALKLPATLIGVNNRDLKTFHTSLETTFSLLQRIPEDRVVITESGIHTTDDVAAMRGHDVHGFLVGEALMKADDPGLRLTELFS